MRPTDGAALGNGGGLGADDAGQAPVAGGDGFEEHLFDGGLRCELVTEGGEETVKVLARFVGLQGFRDDGFGEDAVLERVPAAAGFALGGAGPGGALGVAAVGGELFTGLANLLGETLRSHTLGLGHGSSLLGLRRGDWGRCTIVKNGFVWQKRKGGVVGGGDGWACGCIAAKHHDWDYRTNVLFCQITSTTAPCINC